MRRVKALGAIGLGTALAVGGLSVPAAVAAQVYYVPVTDRLTVHGHGYGHGHGMSQHGAEGAARQGKSFREILAHYYPGTDLGRMRGKIRVLISADTTSDVKVSPARGLTLRDRAGGQAWTLPASDRIDRWRILADGRVQLHNGKRWRRWDVPGGQTKLRGEGEFFAKRPLTLWVPGGGGEVAKRYRGALRSSHGDTVNVLNMDGYLRGVVPAEMPASWSLEALKSQAVAARTYATRDRSANRTRYYQTCDTTSCQVYGGVASEYPSTNTAVRQTARMILRYRGEPAFTQFSSSSGGWTSSGGYPYLPAKQDPWDDWAGNSVHSWSTTVDAGVLERRYGLGNLRAIKVTRRDGNGQWRGRALSVRLTGSKRDVTISGDDFRWAYGLRSNWFTIAQTPIMARWRRIGGASSPVGRPASGEQATAHSGAVQRFRKGRIFWHRRTGARELYGPILREYRSLGAAGSYLRYPRTGVQRIGARDSVVVFQRGRVYRNRPTGVHAVGRGWLRAYSRAGLERGRLGLPTTDVYGVKRGKRMKFEGGKITRRRNGTFRIAYRR
ncbi:MAG TPA: SpoIID/LytB domain-containing protein [Nocardioidaceae bacterium]|nr:SpoIID/LytB domain-containing protein [Nocardioidaceae bacterium]